MKSLKWLLIFSLFLIPLIVRPEALFAQGDTSNELILKKNSKLMVFNGKQLLAAQPLTIKEGSAYAALNGIALPFGYKLSYDKKTREAIARLGTTELRFKAGSSYIKVNGTYVKGPGPTFASKGSLMIPVRMWSNLTDSLIFANGIYTTISWSSRPKADFSVLPAVIYATQTRVTYQDHSYQPNGAKIVEERWEGNEDIFQESGPHTVTHWVMDEHGNWSDPYHVTVYVREPNLAPVADFTTAKDQYRIGEQILYTDRSTDDENSIVRRTWTGNEPVFFEPGDKTVTLEVADKHGLTHAVTKMIHVTDQVLYTREEYGRLYTKVGDKYAMDGAAELKYTSLPYTFENEPAQMVRSNSPEMILEQGIEYDDRLSGKTRFLFHNMNAMDHKIKMYLIATNTNSTTAHVGVGAYGIGGPDEYVTNTGKMSTARYLESLSKNTKPDWTTLSPGQSKIILPQLSYAAIKTAQVLSAYADITTDQDVRFRIVFVDPSVDPLASLGSLKLMPSDSLHVRGTFNNADRRIELPDMVGTEPQRLVLGDRTMDKYIDGIDMTTGDLKLNLGNFGVLYKMKLHVAPRTVIGLNARGGHYTGAFLVNNQLVMVTNNSILVDQHESAVLYRTGDTAEDVDIVFTLASGSNLPIHLLFLPMPELRW